MGKAFLIVLLAVGVGLAAAAWRKLKAGAPQRPASSETVDRTPARIERGRYLAEQVLGCSDCHSKRDFTRAGSPPVGPRGAGGDCVGEQQGFPATVCMSNITPDVETGIGGWTDGQIMRAIREGVDDQGKALFPLMPYPVYKVVSDEDTRAVVAYLRSLPPVKNRVPPAQVGFPLSYYIKQAPAPLAGPVPEVDRNDRVAYGKYLATVSGCQSCHTPVNGQHEPLAGQELSGGQEFRGPWGVVRSTNLTPHATGLGDRSEQAFVATFKAFAVPAADAPRVTPEQNTPMPWVTRAQMTEADLGAIYAYLRSLPPFDRAVERRARPAAPSK
jgi:mono/diheme cytochrome c family protein